MRFVLAVRLLGTGLCLSALIGCVSSPGTVPERAMRPAASTGLMLAPGTVARDTVIPTFGVAPGNDKGVMETLASLRPEEIAPIFSRLRMARMAVPSGDILSLPLPVGNAVTMQTIRAASANICKSIGEDYVDVQEQQRSANGVRKILIRCKKR